MCVIRRPPASRRHRTSAKLLAALSSYYRSTTRYSCCHASRISRARDDYIHYMWRSYASQLPPSNWNVDAKLVQVLTKGTIRDCADMNTFL
jgi:hypothetical protein